MSAPGFPSDSETSESAGRSQPEHDQSEAGRTPLSNLAERVFASCPHGIFTHDLEFRLTLWNPAMERLSGIRKEEALGKVAFDLFPFLKGDGADKTVGGKLSGATVVYDEVPCTVPQTGQRSVYQCEHSPLRNEQGEIIGGFALVSNVTERKRVEERLLESEDRYRDLVEHSTDLICTHDLNGRFLSVNQVAARSMGYTPDEMLGIPMQEFLVPEVRHQFDAYLETIGREGSARGFMVVQTRAGERRIWEYSNTLRTKGVPAPIVRGMARDVTERHQAEKALRKSQTRLELIARASNTGLWDWDLRSNTVYYSPEWKRQVGYAEDEISDHFEEWETRVHPEDLPGAIGRVRNYLAHPQGEFENEFRFRHKDGSYRGIVARASVLKDNEGKPCRMLGSHLDVTERKRAEEALRASEEKFRDLADCIPDIYFAVDGESRITYWNRAAEALTGVPAKDILGRHGTELFPEFLGSYPDQVLHEALRTRQAHTIVHEYQLRGQDCIFESSANPTRSGVSVITRNITARKQAEEALKRNIQLLGDTGEMAKVGGWELDLSTQEVSWTEEVGRIHGVEPGYKPKLEEALNFYAPESRPALEEVLQKAAETGEPYDLESLFIPSGSKDKIWVRSLGKAVYSGGKIVKLAGTFQNIDKYKRAEETLRESEEKHRTLFETMAQGVVYQNAEGHIISANPAAERLLGLTLAQMLGRTSMDPRWKAIHEDGSDFPGDTHAAMIALKTGKEVSHVVMGVFHPGANQYVWINIHAVPRFRPGETKPYQVYTTFDDITERKRAEEQIQSLSRFPAENPNPVLRLQRDGTLIYANPSARPLLQLWGCEVGQRVRADWAGLVADSMASGAGKELEVACDQRVYSFVFAPIQTGGYVNAYGCDITERKRAGQALEESEEKYRLLFSQASDALLILDLETQRFLDANEAASQLYGHTHDEFLGLRAEDISGEPEQTAAALRELKEERSLRVPVRWHRKKDGTIFPVDLSARPFLWKGHQVSCVFVRDITERKRAEEELRQQNEMQQTILDSIPVMIAFLDRESRHHLVNRCWQSTLGWSLEEVQHEDILAQIYPDPAYRKYVLDYIAAAAGTWGDFKSRTRDGRLLNTSWVNVPLSDGSNIGIGMDITERKRVEEALRESEERFRSLVENATVGIYRTTPEGRILMTNAALVRMLGYESFQALATRDLEQEGFEPTYPRSAFRERVEREGEVMGLEAAWKRRDGSTIHVRESARAVRAGDGRVLYYDGIVEDVTERKQLEEQFRQAQKMEAVGRLAGGVAHDFNNILMAVNGYTQLVLRRLSPRHPMRQQVNEIRKAGERAASLTRQLLAFSRRQVLVPRVLDLNKVVADTKEMLRRVIGEDVELVIRQGHKLAKVLADPDQIAEVLVNLAVNAREAMPGGGRLTIETGNVDLREAETGGLPGAAPGAYVMLAVSDTGVGMSKEVMEHLFEPFFTTREQGKGTGLGLSMVYGIVKQSGGYVRVQSEPGHGSTFRIYLPCAQVGSGKPATRSTKARLAKGRGTVLVVEDELAVRQVVAAALRSSGYKVLEAGSGEEAMRRLRRHEGPLHLLLTDLVMPRMNGRQVADSIRPLYPEVKVVFMSGYTDDVLLRQGASGTQGSFLQKPFTMEALTQKVREVLKPAH